VRAVRVVRAVYRIFLRPSFAELLLCPPLGPPVAESRLPSLATLPHVHSSQERSRNVSYCAMPDSNLAYGSCSSDRLGRYADVQGEKTHQADINPQLCAPEGSATECIESQLSTPCRPLRAGASPAEAPLPSNGYL
jgi:hypothetical protein